MHASIAVVMMMVGGPISPESDITTIPLKDDFSSLISMQDMEWKERAKRVQLPRVPTVDDRQQSGDDKRLSAGYRNSGLSTDPNAQHRPTNMPVPPTQADNQQGPLPNMPYQPGGGSRPAGYGPAGGYGAPAVPRNDPYANAVAPGHSGANGINSWYGSPSVPATPGVGNYISNVNPTLSQINSRYGLSNSSNPMVDASAGGGKPYSDYRAPTGYSPWQQLYTSQTNNGTVSPYVNMVRPQIEQQNFNSHVSEQINGVQTMQRGYMPGTPGVELNTGGNGLVNPSTFQNYMYSPTGR